MKIELREKRYRITEKDETGIIPEYAFSAIVGYNSKGEVDYVLFEGSAPLDGEPSPVYETYLDQVAEAEEKAHLNPPRTRKQVIEIVNRLEASVK